MVNQSRELVKWAAVGTAVSLLLSACGAPSTAPLEQTGTTPTPIATIDPNCEFCKIVATKNALASTPTPESKGNPTDLSSTVAQKLEIDKSMIKKITTTLEDRNGKSITNIDQAGLSLSNILVLPIPVSPGSAIAKLIANIVPAAGEFVGYANVAYINAVYWYAILQDNEWALSGYTTNQYNMPGSPGTAILARELSFNYTAKPFLERNDIPQEVKDQAKFIFMEGRFQSPVTCFAKAYELVAGQQNMTVVQYVAKMETGKTTLTNPGPIRPTPEQPTTGIERPPWKFIDRAEATVWQVDDHTVWKIYDNAGPGQKVYSVPLLQRYQELTADAAKLLDGKQVPFENPNLFKWQVEPIGRVFATSDTGYAAIEQRFVDGPTLSTTTSPIYTRILQDISAYLNKQLNTDVINLTGRNIKVVGDTWIITDLLNNVAGLANEVTK